MEAEYAELIAAFKALQLDYEQIGFRNDNVYARVCHALDWADKNNNKVMALLKAGENADDWAKHQGTED
jgi:hypothetical protein